MYQRARGLRLKEIYGWFEDKMGISMRGYAVEDILTRITQYLVQNWNDNYAFVLWGVMYRYQWSMTLPRILRQAKEFAGVAERYLDDPRRKHLV